MNGGWKDAGWTDEKERRSEGGASGWIGGIKCDTFMKREAGAL